jgi:endonuclease/exonuclease/phosphatase family metal-dependent hydrolase
MKWRGKRRVYVPVVTLCVLTWNLFHGRSLPPARRYLLDEFADALGRWEWDVALLQEVPPWWPAAFGERLGVDQRRVMTSRNALLPVRRAIAVHWPDLIKSNGGGCNAILVRGDTIVEHRTRRLTIWPERRWVHGVRLAGAGVWAANLHATVHNPAGAARDARQATATARAWAGERPVILGGDFNLRQLSLDGFGYAGGHDVDLVFLRGLDPASPAEVLDHGHLSDHAPVRVTAAAGRTPAAQT